jgi:phosphoribosylformimino-5-aminoimidazole carboxamide ribotide isomerase
MEVLPAIDLMGGRAVRLVEGREGTERDVSADPVALAREWEARGAAALHVVDLDAALERGDNLPIIRTLVKRVRVPVQVGGGVRDETRLQAMFRAGAARVVVGTRGVRDRDWLRRAAASRPGRIVLAVDARGRAVVVRGWKEAAGLDVCDLARQVANVPLAALLYTNVEVEGHAQGIRLRPVNALLRAAAQPVIYSGGVARAADIARLRARGVAGVVLGTGLYFGRLSFADALAAAGGPDDSDGP